MVCLGHIIKYHHKFCWLLFWKTGTRAGGTTTENPTWANSAPSPVASCEGRGLLSLREALLSWWPTTLPSLSARSQTQDGKVADAEEEEGGFRGFQTWH